MNAITSKADSSVV